MPISPFEKMPSSQQLRKELGERVKESSQGRETILHRTDYKRPNELMQQLIDVRDFITPGSPYYHKIIELPPKEFAEMDELLEALNKLIEKHIERESVFDQLKYVLGIGPLYLRGDAKRWKGLDILPKKLEKTSQQKSKLYNRYVKVLRMVKQQEEEDIQEKLTRFLDKIEPNPDLEKEIERTTIPLGARIAEDSIELLRKNFPSGNFLIHTTSVGNFSLVVESGALMTPEQIEVVGTKDWRRGGGGAENDIAFSMNNIRVLIGDKRHFTAFVVAPEAILDDDTELRIPDGAGVFEVRFGSRDPQKVPTVPLENTFVLCNERDVNKVRILLAAYHRRPRGVLTYPNRELRVASLAIPVGDHKVLGKLLRNTWDKAGLSPSINWEGLFRRKPVIDKNTYVRKESIKGSKRIIQTSRVLQVVD